MLITELITQLGFDVDFGPLDKFDSKIDETKDGLDKMGAAADDAMDQVKKAVTTVRNTLIGLTVGAVAGSAALIAIAKSAANVGDEISKTAPMLGFSVEEYQKYRYAAELAGVENESFAASTQLLLNNIGEARAGNLETAKSFKKLGISVAELKHMSTAEVFRKMSEGLERIPDQATRIKLSMDVLGRSGARMGEFLAKGTGNMDSLMQDVEAFGMFTKESAEQANDFNDSLDRVRFFLSGIKNEIGARLFPVFRGMLDDVREWLSLNREIIKSKIEKFVNFLTAAITKSWNVVKRIVHAFETMIKALGGLENAFQLLGVAILAPLILLIGPVLALAKGTMFLIIPFIRLHTLISLVTFAISSMIPLWTILISVVSALVATKIVGFFIEMAGGYRAIAAAIVGPTLLFIAQAAAIAFLILAFEDLTTWLYGGKSIIGDWIGTWAEVPDKLRKIWDKIKAVFQEGGKFIAAVFRGDFAEAYRILDETAEKTKKNLEVAGDSAAAAMKGPSSTKGTFADLGNYSMAGGYIPTGSPSGNGYAHAPNGPGHRTFLNSYMLGAGLNGAPGAPGKSQGAVTQHVTAEVNVNLPKGTPQEHAEETARVFKGLMDEQVNHSLNQSVPPGS